MTWERCCELGGPQNAPRRGKTPRPCALVGAKMRVAKAVLVDCQDTVPAPTRRDHAVASDEQDRVRIDSAAWRPLT
jgi:hypothetical protein